MFDRFSGLPAHPLLIHAAVVFVPLLALGAIAYALLPFLRRHLWWPLLLLAIAGAASIFAARQSGVTFSKNKNLASPQIQAKITEHQGFGTKAMWWTFGLTLIALAMLAATRHVRRIRAWRGDGGAAAVSRVRIATIPELLFSILSVGIGLAVLYYVYKTGDSGAHMAWEGY